METFNNRLQAFWTFAGKRKKAAPAISGFVHPSQKRKSLIGGVLQKRKFYEADKTGQPTFRLPQIVCFLSIIVCIAMYYMSTGCTTFAANKIKRTNKNR
jgi:hypothetical protein